jgi:hypothetical protein
VDFDIGDDAASLEAFVERFSTILDAPPAAPWVLDLSECRSVSAGAVALIAALVFESREAGRAVDVVLPEAPKRVIDYCRHSGLAQLVGRGSARDPDEPWSDAVPVARFQRAVWGAAEPLVRLIRRHAPLSADDEDALRLCVSEVSQIIDDHADPLIGGVFAARLLPSTREFRVAIVDRGRGIAETLRRRYPDIRDAATALIRVLTGEYTARSLPRNKGLGIQNLSATVGRLAGSLILLTGDGLAEASPESARPTVRTGRFRYRGTGVFFTLPLSAADATAEEPPA